MKINVKQYICKIAEIIVLMCVLATLSYVLCMFSCTPYAEDEQLAQAPTPSHRYTFDTDITSDSAGELDLTVCGATIKDGRAELGDGKYLEIPVGAVTTDAVTFMTDITPMSTADFQKIVTFGFDQTYYFQIALRTGTEGRVNVEAQLTGTGSGEVAVYGYTANNVFETGKTYSLAVTVDAGDMRIYVNGILVNGRKCPYTMAELIAKGPSCFYIGKSLWNDPYFTGEIDNFEIYDCALTAEQIAAKCGAGLSSADIENPSKYYSFDDSNALCLNDATLVADALNNGATGTEGKSGTAAAFATDAYIQLNKDVVSGNEFTFAAWIYPTSVEDWQKIIDIGSGTGHYLQLALRNCGKDDRLNIQAGMTMSGGESHVWGSLALESIMLNTWSHVALTVDGNYVRIYVNGKILQSGYFDHTVAEFTAISALNTAYMGKSQFSDPTYKGVMDEAVFYTRSLGIRDVEKLAGGQLPTKATPQTADIEQGLTHYYSYDNTDYPGLDNTGEGGNASAILGVKQGKYGTAADFSGGYVHLPENIIPSSGIMTFATWIYPTSRNDFQKVTELGRDTEAFLHIMLRPGSDSNKMNIETALTVDGDQGPTSTHIWGGAGYNAVTLNAWSHVALIVERTSARLYVDGIKVLDGTFKRSLAELAAEDNAQIANYIGKSHFNDPNFSGYVDETVVYARALSETDVRALAGGDLPEKKVTDGKPVTPPEVDLLSGLELYYSFDGKDVGTDFSGNKKNAIISNKNMKPTENKDLALGGSLAFNGYNDFLILPENTVSKTSAAFTFAAWIKFDTSDEYIRIFDFGEAMSYFDLRLRAGSVLESTLTNNSTSGESRVATMSGAIKQNVWQHIALTVDGSSVNIYVDGSLSGSGKFAKPLTGLYDKINYARQNFIGLSRYAQDGKFKGGMDEIRIYNRALSADDAAALAGGEKAEVVGAETDDAVYINGVYPEVNYIESLSGGLTRIGRDIAARKMTVAEFIGNVRAVNGTVLSVTDNYDFALSDGDSIYDGCYLRIKADGAYKDRIRIRVGAYRTVAFDSDGGNEKDPVTVLEGTRLALPYVVKSGYEFVAWYDGQTECGATFTVTEDVTLKAVYERRKYTVILDMRNGTFNTLSAFAGDAVTLGDFGDPDVVGYRSGGEMLPLGEMIMPAHSIYLRAVYRLNETDDLIYTEFHGGFDNDSGEIVSSATKSLLLFDEAQFNSGVIEVNVTPTSANDCGVLVWANDGGRDAFWEDAPASYHVVLLNWEGYLLIGKVNHNGKTWECVSEYRLDGYDPTRTYNMKVEIVDNNIKVYLDGTLRLDYTEKGDAAGARVGLRTESGGTRFDVVSVAAEEKKKAE